MSNQEITKLNGALRKNRAARSAGVEANGQLWARSHGYGETQADLDAAMEAADATLRKLGFERDESQAIFRQGIDFGQALKAVSLTGQEKSR